ncbi:hypothetical protein E4U14_000213 [Claviceps sp. LM454 group G7]|nr:hypothetical protein E4U14_000213 [Claviceps sp. LM454 group G7]
MIKVAEKPVCTDHRSFAATTFESATFKMPEWLTPEGLQAMFDKFSDPRNLARPAKLDSEMKDEASEASDAVSPVPSSPKKPKPTKYRSNEVDFLGPTTMSEVHPKPHKSVKRLVRRAKPDNAAASSSTSAQWKAFNEQTLFSVMSDPHALVNSFTKDGKLYDSQTLWYYLLRMTCAAPSIVLHNLQLAAKSLFVPPQSLKSG